MTRDRTLHVLAIEACHETATALRRHLIGGAVPKLDVVWVDSLDAADARLRDASFDAVVFGLPSPPSEARDGVRRVREAFESGPLFLLGDVRVATPEDAVFWERAVATGPALGLLVRGEIERFRLAARLERAESEHRDAHRLETVGELASGIAHDFNNLLHGILGQAELAADAVTQGKDPLRFIGGVQQAGRSAREFTEQLMSYVTCKSKPMETLDLSGLVHSMDRVLRTVLNRGSAVDFDLAGDLEPSMVDAVQLKQVVLNLVCNASQAIGATPGRVRIKTEMVALTRRDLTKMEIGDDLRPGSYTALSVSDTGRGMTREVIARVFEPCFSAREDGHGIGMATVLRIVRRHFGAIQVTSVVDEGTTVRVFIPRAASAPTSTASKTRAPARRTPTPARVPAGE